MDTIQIVFKSKILRIEPVQILETVARSLTPLWQGK
jgi:hypothetical protein